jgi:hypothetical protein
MLGGYLFDAIHRERQRPTNDWRWNFREQKLQKIPSIPGDVRINFGIAAVVTHVRQRIDHERRCAQRKLSSSVAIH